MKRRIKVCPIDAAEQILQQTDALGAHWVAIGEPDFPALLRHADACPPLLCLKGTLTCLHNPPISIVGARNASAAGLKFTRQIAAGLCSSGFCVVSGLARGVDTAAHHASCAYGTLAVIAGGIDNIYPPENAQLYQRIVDEGGAIVTEMVPGTVPQAKHFPRRNRIISGISYGVVVVEAAYRSGSLITARLANEQNRLVFAVPGSPMDPRAAGTNQLIRNGAILVSRVEDITEQLAPMLEMELPFDDSISEPQSDNLLQPKDVPESARERIIALLGPAPVEIDDLIRESSEAPSLVLTVLLELELAGKLQRHGGHRVSII